MNIGPNKSHVKLALLVIAIAFALLVWTMSRSGRVVEGPGMDAPDVEHNIAAALYVQPVGLVEKGTVVAARSAYNGVLEMRGTRHSVASGEVVYHRFDVVGNHLIELVSGSGAKAEPVLIAVREGGQSVPNACSVDIIPRYPVVGEPIRAINCSPLPPDALPESCMVRWDNGESRPLDETVVFHEPGLHTLSMEMKMKDDNAPRFASTSFAVFDVKGNSPGNETPPVRPRMALFPESSTAFTRQNVFVCDVSEGRLEHVVDRMVNWGDGVGQHLRPRQNKLKHNYRKPGTYTVQFYVTLESGQRMYVETKLKISERQ